MDRLTNLDYGASLIVLLLLQYRVTSTTLRVTTMENKNLICTTFLVLFFSLNIQGQTNFSDNPLEAKFITEDVERFWEAFDRMDTSNANPFNEYLEKGSLGVKGFTEGRIINADSLISNGIKKEG